MLIKYNFHNRLTKLKVILSGNQKRVEIFPNFSFIQPEVRWKLSGIQIKSLL